MAAVAKTGGYAIRITAVDGASRQIEAVNRRLAALRAPIDRMQASMARFAKLSGLRALSNGFGELASRAADAARSVASIVPGLSAITGAATIAGMARLVSSWADFGTELLHGSQRLGMSASALHSLQGAARLAGADAGSLTSGLQTLGDTMQDAVAGRAPDALRLFNAMGVSIHKSSFEAKSAAEVLPQVADRIARIRHPAIQAQIATQLFGGAAERLLPFLKRGAAGIAEYTRMAAEYGVQNDKGVEQAEKLREAQAGVALAFQGLGMSIAQHVGPVLTPLLRDFGLWIARNREWIATGIGEQVRRFSEWVRGIDFKAVVAGAREWWDWLDKIVQKMGGWETVTVAVLGLWAASKLAPIITAVTLLAGAFAKLGAAMLGLGGPAAAGGGFLRKLLLRLGFNPATLVLGGIAGAHSLMEPMTEEQKKKHAPHLAAPNDGMGVGGVPVRPIAPSGSRQGERAKEAFDYFRSQGDSAAVAAAKVAQIEAESSFNERAVHDGGKGFGIMGWQKDRLHGPDGLSGFLDRTRGTSGNDPRSATWQEQYRFLDWESRNGPQAPSARRGMAANDPRVAGYWLTHDWVRPGMPGDGGAHKRRQSAARSESAQQWHDRLKDRPVPGSGQAAPSVNAVTQPPAQKVSMNGAVGVNIAFANAPAGMTWSSDSSGIAGPASIANAMPAFG